MTHYMELLAVNQPWNLIIYMAIPVILAEIIAVTELYLLFTKKNSGKIKNLNKFSGIIVGIYFLIIAIYLFVTVFIPLTLNQEWRGLGDFIAVTFYLLGAIPLFGITLLELNIISKEKSPEEKNMKHAMFVGVFLVVAHIAMIFGMLNPEVLGYKAEPENQMIMEHGNM